MKNRINASLLMKASHPTTSCPNSFPLSFKYFKESKATELFPKARKQASGYYPVGDQE
jgi:hypothetical protein